MKILEDLLGESSTEADTEATNVLNTVLAHPLVLKVVCTPDTMNTYTKPIILKNPYGEGTLNLGSLIIQLRIGGYFKVNVNKELSNAETGRSEYLQRLVHPHVSKSDGSVCQGNTQGVFAQFYRERNIPMFITFMLEFLQTYDNRSPYWRPWFKEPCDECGMKNTERCKWCVCSKCSSKIEGTRCGGCERWKQQSAGAACAYIKSFLDSRVANMDEDDFITAITEIEKVFK